jgi:hypothetical protein
MSGIFRRAVSRRPGLTLPSGYAASVASSVAYSRARERVCRICEPAGDTRTLRLDLLDAIRRVVGFDAYAWLVTDPETSVGSAPLADVPLLPELPQLIRLKYLTTINRWTALRGRAVGTYLPPQPEFVSPPLMWGDEQYVRELFEGTGIGFEFEREVADIHHDSVAAAVDCYATKFGPVVTARELLDAAGRWPALRDDMTRLFERHNASGGTRVVFPAQYLVVLGRKAG